ncbi:MAG: DUF1778 domain-containing protein [Gammaproteobacteria bacterium]|nr:DUF1778 domain-containing protein [Gammaproteobacteria bacterium]
MSVRASRLDIRTTKQTKGAIESAANFLGVTTSAFVVECAMERAAKVLEQAQSIHLNASESRHFLDLLENPPEPNENLKQLFKLHGNKKQK